MKLNNKGFAISTVLYGLLALVILIIMLIFQVMRTSNNNSKALGQSITEELKDCRNERINYQTCTENCEATRQSLKKCLKEYQCKQTYSNTESLEYSECINESE